MKVRARLQKVVNYEKDTVYISRMDVLECRCCYLGLRDLKSHTLFVSVKATFKSLCRSVGLSACLSIGRSYHT